VVSWQLWTLERGLAAIAGSSRRAELASLTESLAASSAAARDPESLDELAKTIVSVRNELLSILAQVFAEEGQGMGFDFAQDRLSLQGRIPGNDPESRELETIRKLLLAETRSLDSEFRRLAKARVKAADKCQRGEADLAGEVSRHQQRLEAWHSAARRAQELQARLQIFQQRRSGQVPPMDPPATPDWEEPPAQVWVREVRPAAKVEVEIPPPPEPKPRRRSEPRPQPAPPTPSPAMVADSTTPPLSLLDPPSDPPPAAWGEAARSRMGLIEETLGHFGVQAQVVAAVRGPAVTRYEIEPGPGEKISRISGLSNDLARSLSAGAVRIEAPIPGKNVIGLEVPNAERELVRLSDAMGSAF
jgi:S-DNA-T family DNA segregation ATPase FtsK/SpoIIIE